MYKVKIVNLKHQNQYLIFLLDIKVVQYKKFKYWFWCFKLVIFTLTIY